MKWEDLRPPYATIVVDPPWHYDQINPPNPATGYAGGSLSYSTMSLDEIKALPVGDLASDTRCFLWTTNRYLRHSWDVLESWGFTTHDKVLVWCKPPMGTLQVTTEYVVIGRKGNPPRMPWHPTTWFLWSRKGGHSAKPDAFLDLVEKWCPGPYVELFCRRQRAGWDSWGKGYELPPVPARGKCGICQSNTVGGDHLGCLIASLVEDGYTLDSATDAVISDDFSKLKQAQHDSR